MRILRARRHCLAVLATCAMAVVAVHAGEVRSAAALREVHGRTRDALARSPLGRPLLLSSAERPHGLQGEIYAVVEQPLAAIRSAFDDPAHWCEVLLLHVNNRRCETGQDAGRQRITLGIVRRYDKPVADAFDLPFVFSVLPAGPDYLEVRLEAAAGPLGTRNYDIQLEAVALDAQRSFVHFSYSYEQNAMVALAVETYLALFGSDKVGFTEVGPAADGRPRLIAGARGLVERNAMRYFLALEAFMAHSDSEARRQAWFSGTERYPRQLREVDRETYLGLKRDDAARRPVKVP